MAEEGYSEVNYKSISCEQIPEIFLDKLIAKKHFSKFGKISRFILRPNRLSCTVEYETEAEAERAVEEAGLFNGKEFPINFAEREVGHVQNTEEWVDADVQAELDAMGAGQNQTRQINPTMASRIFSMPAKRNSPQRLGPKVSETPPATIAPKIDTALRSELEALLRQPAYSAEERYRVLDARDKLIRLTSVKQTDIAKTESRKGTCPDMCPEKERLMRDFQRQVAIFETNKSSMIGSISHRHAIKEYSRSSADQEVPLLHELRPANVLKMTMLYLMSRIMDQLETTQVNVSDWFHFVWDRTRSIRKDITQQELCSLDAVELVEQCARFHIHCAARLVAEDPSVFDKKINAENLTKCLQTLKYLYHDLRLKNIPCPREAEFRGYIVLLNLGNSNFLWEIKNLPEHIQQSTEIKRAMAFYNVLQNNNYVRFFKMVREKETSYLSACILLGYFTRLRWRALEAIVKSHNWRKNSVFIRIDYLTKILGFEDEEAAVQFFKFHGLHHDVERGVLLDRPQHAVDYCMERALMLVESKRTVSVGECICGRPLESAEIFENHQPHNSFDDNGILKPEAWSAIDQLRGEAALQKAKEETTKQPLIQTPTTKLDSIFKVPQTSQLTAAAKQSLPHHIAQPAEQQPSVKPSMPGFSFFAPTTSSDPSASSSSSDSIFNTIATKNSNSGGNLFMGSTLTNGTAGSAGKNIFGNIPKTSAKVESTTFFPAPAEAKLFDVPRSDNVFQYFDTTSSNFGRSEGVAEGIFPSQQTVQEEHAAKQKMLAAEIAKAEAQRRAAAEAARQLQLEEERRRKLEEIERQRKTAEAAAKRAQAERKEKLAVLQRCAEKESDGLISTTLNAEISKIAKSELQIYQSLEKHTKNLTEELLNEFIGEEVREIATAEYSIHCHDRMLLERYFNIWLQATRKKITQRKVLETTPMWVTTDTREEQTQQLLHPSELYNMHMIKRYRHGEPCDFRKLLWDEGSELSCRASIDICEMISKHLEQKKPISHIQQRTYMKLLFTLPAEMDEIPGFESLCSKWLKHVLRFPLNNDDSQSYICTLQGNVALCVRKVCGTTPMINESGKQSQHSECDNVDGIVCFMTCADLASTRRRLHHLLQKSRNFRKLPISFVVYGNSDYDTEVLAMTLDLESLRERGLLCSFKFYYCLAQKTEYTFKVNLERALHFTIHSSLQLNHRNASGELIMDKTQNWLETCLGEEMWRRWQITESQNPAFRKVCTIVQHVIGLYNMAIRRLCEIINENLEHHAEFAMELKQFVPNMNETNCTALGLEYFPIDWKSKRRQKALLDFMKRIQLPKIQKPPPDDVNELKLWLLDYAGCCIPKDDEKSAAAAYHAIKALIEQLTAEEVQTLEIKERMHFVSFLPVLKPLIFAHINEQLSTNTLPSEIVFHSEKLRCYLEQPWWLSYEAVEAVKVDYNAVESQHFDQQTTNYRNPADDIEAALKRAAEVSQIFEQKMNTTKDRSKEMSLLEQLDQTMHDLEVAELAGVYDVQIPISKRKYSRKQKENRAEQQHDVNDEPSRKRMQTGKPHSFSEVNDVISRALSVIEKANARQDAKVRLDYSISKLDL